ncbi:MAG: amidase domain-containing protein [Coprothermobacterota bacterium]|nr:amidase domain-containing protein [Coprothermobacterota bacterium]
MKRTGIGKAGLILLISVILMGLSLTPGPSLLANSSFSGGDEVASLSDFLSSLFQARSSALMESVTDQADFAFLEYYSPENQALTEFEKKRVEFINQNWNHLFRGELLQVKSSLGDFQVLSSGSDGLKVVAQESIQWVWKPTEMVRDLEQYEGLNRWKEELALCSDPIEKRAREESIKVMEESIRNYPEIVTSYYSVDHVLQLIRNGDPWLVERDGYSEFYVLTLSPSPDYADLFNDLCSFYQSKLNSQREEAQLPRSSSNESISPDGLSPNTYCRNYAVSYSRQWALGHNPFYGNLEPTDCANFVSQSLVSGNQIFDNRYRATYSQGLYVADLKPGDLVAWPDYNHNGYPDHIVIIDTSGNPPLYNAHSSPALQVPLPSNPPPDNGQQTYWYRVYMYDVY